MSGTIQSQNVHRNGTKAKVAPRLKKQSGERRFGPSWLSKRELMASAEMVIDQLLLSGKQWLIWAGIHYGGWNWFWHCLGGWVIEDERFLRSVMANQQHQPVGYDLAKSPAMQSSAANGCGAVCWQTEVLLMVKLMKFKEKKHCTGTFGICIKRALAFTLREAQGVWGVSASYDKLYFTPQPIGKTKPDAELLAFARRPAMTGKRRRWATD